MSKVLKKPTIEYRACLSCEHLQRDLVEKEEYFEWVLICKSNKENTLTFQPADCPEWKIGQLI